jgi:hypothetical protein
MLRAVGTTTVSALACPATGRRHEKSAGRGEQ